MKAPSRVAVALGEGVGTNLKIVLDPLHTFHLPRQFGRAGLALGPWNRTRQRNRSPFGGDQDSRQSAGMVPGQQRFHIRRYHIVFGHVRLSGIHRQ